MSRQATLSSSNRSSGEYFDVARAASHLTEESMEQEGVRAGTVPSSESREPRWPGDVEIAPTISNDTEQGCSGAWYLSRFPELIPVSEMTPDLLTESVGSQFQTAGIPLSEEVIARIDQIILQQVTLR